MKRQRDLSAYPNYNPPTLPDLIRRETDDGLIAVRFLVDLMDARIEGAKITDRLAAARELLDRGFGKPNAAAASAASGDDSDAEREAAARAMLAERIRRALDATPETPKHEKPPLPQGEGWGGGEPPETNHA